MTHSSLHTARNAALFTALLATSLALGGALAHAFEFLNKIDMDQQQYFTAQRIYDGWNKIAYLLLIELLGMLAVIGLYWRAPRVRWQALGALASFLTAQAVFWVWTFPANMATDNWTTQPETWQALRNQWEYSHLAGAGFQLLAMIFLILATLRRTPEPDLKIRPA